MTARGGIYGDMHGDGKPVDAPAERPFVEVKLPEGTYRFYGQGEWRWLFCGEFVTVNAIFVPREALRIAALAAAYSGPPCPYPSDELG